MQKIHIPIGEYAFIEEEFEGKSVEELVARANEIRKAYEPKVGLPDKAFDEFIQRQLEGGKNHIEEYNAMSPEQQKFVQVTKRALKRIEYNQSKETDTNVPEDINLDK
jgi:hypothetical protein